MPVGAARRRGARGGSRSDAAGGSKQQAMHLHSCSSCGGCARSWRKQLRPLPAREHACSTRPAPCTLCLTSPPAAGAQESTGYRVEVATVRRLEFENDTFAFGDKLIAKWYKGAAKVRARGSGCQAVQTGAGCARGHPCLPARTLTHPAPRPALPERPPCLAAWLPCRTRRASCWWCLRARTAR